MGAGQSTPAPPVLSAKPAEGCPMREGQVPTDQSINPLNRMPNQPQQAPAPGQTVVLPIRRTMSSIPRAENMQAVGSASACPVVHSTPSATSPIESSEGVKVDLSKPQTSNQWEYPSPQQFYNALVRKGWETPEESIVMMVDIHNWLNEAAWQQVRVWEEKHDGGDRSQLARFEGRPQDVSPKARYHLLLGSILPSRFHYVKPFDRHDWLIHRPAPSNSSSSYTAPSSTQAYTTHRYVIDYYALPDDAQGNPVFSLDVRPAVDSFAAVGERLTEWARVKKEAWSSNEASTIGVKVQEEK